VAASEPGTPIAAPRELATPKKRPRQRKGMILATISCQAVAIMPAPKACQMSAT